MSKNWEISPNVLASVNVLECVQFSGFCVCEVNQSVRRQKAGQAAAARPPASPG